MFNEHTSPLENAVVLAPPPHHTREHDRLLLALGHSRLRPMLADLLTAQGFHLLEASDRTRAFDFALNRRCSLVLLDFSALGGRPLLSRLRENSPTLPILALAPDAAVHHRIESLNHGADDCLAQPFDPNELVARIRALLRRRTACPGPSRLQLGELVIDLERMTAQRGPELLRLSRTECAILDLLSKNRGLPVSRARMLDIVWGYTYLPNTRTLDTHIWRLRKKLGDSGDHPRWIVNVTGVGYQLQAG